MEEKSLKVYDTEKTFFSKITNTLNKILAPGKMGLNSMIISMKRNNVLKNYENYIQNEKNSDRKGMLLKKYEESYSLYLEAIDKYIMDSVYKKVKSEFGINLRIKPKDVTSSLLSWCKGSLNLNDVISKLKEKEANNPWIS